MFGVIHFCVCLCVFVSSTYADRDDRKWVWDDNKRGSARFIDSHSEAAERYNVYEGDQNGGPLYTEVLPRPQPIIPERPGNVYLDNNQGAYGLGAGSYHVTNGVAQGVLTGPVQNQVPLQDLDRCKCTQKFNCQGIAYGHCDVGKQYCCYSSSQVKPQGVFRPAVPGNSIDSNGVLVGPGATRPGYGLENGVLTAPKPGYGLENGILTAPARPVVRPHRPSIVGGHNRRPFNGNTYSSANGVLVGPGGPIDRPGYGFARSN